MDRDDDDRRPLDVLCDEIVERYHATLHQSLPRVGAIGTISRGAENSARCQSRFREFTAEFVDPLVALISPPISAGGPCI